MSPRDTVRKTVCEWYGMFSMPLTVMTREEEEEKFETAHPEIPKHLWEVVNHRTRQAFLWARHDDVDIVVKDGNGYKMVQDLFFKDAYDTDADWRRAVMEWIASCQEVWVVYHDEVYLA